jgi:methylase of polypeptide subunit release factors
MVEIGFGQAGAVSGLFSDGGFTGVAVTPDYAGIARVVEGRKP